MKKFSYWLLNLLLFVLSGIFIYSTLSPLFHGLVIKGDSLSSLWWGETDFFGTFLKNDHPSIILSMFICLFGRYIPEMLHIHPQVWYTDYYYLIIFLLMYILQYAIADNFTKYFQNQKFKILWMFLTFPIFIFLMISSSADWIITDDVWSFAYIFMPVFSVVFLSVCEKLYVKNSMDKVINIPPPPHKHAEDISI